MARKGQDYRFFSGTNLESPDSKIKKGFKKGWDDYLALPKKK